MPVIFIAIFAIFYIYDKGLESEEISPEIISETLTFPALIFESNLSKNIHIVQKGENLSLIFERYKVSLNDTYKIFRKDQSGEIKNILPNDRLEFYLIDNKLQKITIVKGPLLSF